MTGFNMLLHMAMLMYLVMAD